MTDEARVAEARVYNWSGYGSVPVLGYASSREKPCPACGRPFGEHPLAGEDAEAESLHVDP